MIKEVTIIDYDAGNIFNLYNSLSRLNCNVKITSSAKEIEESERLIMPGVGAFKEGLEKTVRWYLNNLNWSQNI